MCARQYVKGLRVSNALYFMTNQGIGAYTSHVLSMRKVFWVIQLGREDRICTQVSQASAGG